MRPLVFPLGEDKVETIDWIPQAIFRRPIERFRTDDVTYFEGEDGLDSFRGVHGIVNDFRFAIRNYPGFPGEVVQFYLTPDITDLNVITAAVALITSVYGLTNDEIWWMRGEEDPDQETLRSKASAT